MVDLSIVIQKKTTLLEVLEINSLTGSKRREWMGMGVAGMIIHI